MLDLCCPAAFSLAVVCRLLVAAASPLVSEHRIWGAQASVAAVREFPSAGSALAMHGLAGSVACGVLPAQGPNPGLLHRRWILNH